MTAAPRAALIGVDWGTSNLRVMRIGGGGQVLDSRDDARGAGKLEPRDFPRVLREVAGDWLEDALPIVACGMAGAQGRWRETAYVPCPAGLGDLAAALVRPDAGLDVAIVPGVAVLDEQGLADVMRGEETQAMGMFDGDEAGLIVAPGTHSKWVSVKDGRIVGFRTFVTGELFSAIRQATILGAGLDDGGRDEAAFLDGVRHSLADTAITASLFSLRARRLSGRLHETAASDYLSGLLIGAEIAAQSGVDRRARLRVVGAPGLAERYRLAMQAAGFMNTAVADGQAATATGLWRIWSAAR